MKTKKDVRAAVELDADAIGFVLTESPREISLAAAMELKKHIPDSIRTHAVFGPVAPDIIIKLFKELSEKNILVKKYCCWISKKPRPNCCIMTIRLSYF